MRLEKTNVLLLCIIGMLLCAGGASADYVEGIDTTDVSGYGLDSAFSVIGGIIYGKNVIYFSPDGIAGYFNYSFDDIKMAPDSNKYTVPSWGAKGLHCFVTKNNKDSTYSKVQILEQLSDSRYVFKYGTNSIPNNRMLEKANYDRSVRYKPNNFNSNSWENVSTWDPPLPNNNHLIGYIHYWAKQGITIDTTKPINLAQWDSIAFTTSTMDSFTNNRTYWNYFNLVAVYTEGKSEFLKGWTILYSVGVKQNSQQTEKLQNTLVVKREFGGYLISLLLSSFNNPIKSLSIYNAMGIKISRISSINKNQVFWKTSDRNLPEGLYIARLELSDKTSCSRAFILSSR